MLHASETILTILVVEDDEAIRAILQLTLELRGYHVAVADNGRTGLAVLKTIERPCLILLDLMMPVMSGWDFLNALQNENHTGIPVVLMTAYSYLGGDTNIKETIRKPFDLQDLVSTVARYCRAT